MTTTPKTRTSGGNALTVLSEDELGSAAQRDRRKRILDATIALASKGGFEAVQMRAVAEKADVALGTLYRYFPSKIHLLVSGLARELERGQERLDRTTIPGDTPYDRVLFILGRVTRAMQRDPHLTEAMTRAFMFADATAATEVDTVGKLMDRMFTRAMHPTDAPTEEDRAIARAIADARLSNLAAWVTRPAPATPVADPPRLSARLLPA